jgi:hypothetical protein
MMTNHWISALNALRPPILFIMVIKFALQIPAASLESALKLFRTELDASPVYLIMYYSKVYAFYRFCIAQVILKSLEFAKVALVGTS